MPDGLAGRSRGRLSGQASGRDPGYRAGGRFPCWSVSQDRESAGKPVRCRATHRRRIVFLDIIENHPGNVAYGDALYYYADSLFLARDYLGAKDWFTRLLNERTKPGVAAHTQQAIERLIEIAIHLDKFDGIEAYFSQLGQVPSEDARYTKGKFLYFKGDLAAALTEFEAIRGGSLVGLKAAYLKTAVLTRQGRFQDAIAVVNLAREHKAKNPEEQEIVDLLNLAAGRLYYEQNFIEHASECYQRINNRSPYFDVALYEAATVLIRSGDAIRAERVLEVLTVAIPDSKYIPRAKMLRGNLLLRTGRYEEAEKVFSEMSDEFGPVMNELDRLISEQQDTRKFFGDLVKRSISSLDNQSALPPLVVKWVGEERDVQHALGLAADIGTVRETVQDAERLIRLLEAVINGPSRVNAIPILRDAMRRAQQLQNRLVQMRAKLLSVAEKEFAGSSELAQLAAERRALTSQLKALPTTVSAFETRENESRKVFERMHKELSRNEVRVDQLSAMIVAIDRFIADPRYTEGADPAAVAALSDELARHKVAVAGMASDLGMLKGDVDGARYQVGVGDSADESDRALADRLKAISGRQRQIFASRGPVGQSLDQALVEVDATDGTLQRFAQEVDAEARRRVEEMRQLVSSERDAVVTYKSDLVVLGDEAQTVVGDITYANFSNVRRKFQDLILKADVGIIDVAWLRKEEHSSRRDELTKERLQDIRILDDEFQEVRTEEAESRP
ncbi:MAG: tetratricopeptide repeat protein [Myxococcota bacterium]|nr:tetratricopeptide repeat protein [Myxococcota bacterium]